MDANDERMIVTDVRRAQENLEPLHQTGTGADAWMLSRSGSYGDACYAMKHCSSSCTKLRARLNGWNTFPDNEWVILQAYASQFERVKWFVENYQFSLGQFLYQCTGNRGPVDFARTAQHRGGSAKAVQGIPASTRVVRFLGQEFMVIAMRPWTFYSSARSSLITRRFVT